MRSISALAFTLTDFFAGTVFFPAAARAQEAVAFLHTLIAKSRA